MNVQVHWTERAEKDMKRLGAKLREEIVTAVNDYARTGHGDVRFIEGRKPLRRLKVGQHWRVLFTYDAKARIISVKNVKPRESAYEP